MMSEGLKRIEIPIILTAIFTLIQVIPYYFDNQLILDVADRLNAWVLLIVAMATAVGLFSIFQVHGKRVQRQSEGWYYSVILLVVMVVMALTGLPIESIGLGTDNAIYDFLFTNVQTPLGSTMYSILAFFIASAAYRAFRARNVEASIVLVAGILVVISNAPFFTSMWGGFITIREWIFDVPNASTMRGVLMGAALGAVALATRTLLGIERGYLRGGGED
ncbi:MAG: hypothetical protein JSV18_06610 [Candidatus Bathyarchaeota archaeon]|nr:MAG: hypothetical protein JSV18_06610 [Candidatus Bathyarchaeota archaeon]